MKALRKLHQGPSDLVVSEVPVPEPNTGEVRVAVFAAGMCGTDLHIMDGTYASHPPVTLGHEIAGVVDAVGPEVDPSWIHVRVCAAPAISCGICEWCQIGLPMHCPGRLSAGTSLDGGFAPYVVVPTRNLFRLPTVVSDYAGALVEPLACVCNALMDPDVISAGDRVVVIGPGTIGILAAQVAMAAGGHVTLVGLGTDAHRLDIASQIGIDSRSLDDLQTRTDLGLLRCSTSRRLGAVPPAPTRSARATGPHERGVGRPAQHGHPARSHHHRELRQHPTCLAPRTCTARGGQSPPRPAGDQHPAA